jgi:predicted  nucleic acid-binding Zn-ribbon protein
MGSFLEKLYQYHLLTHRLYILNQQIAAQRSRARVQERKIADHAVQLEQLRAKVKAAQSAAGEAELDLKSREATLDKLRGQLNTAKTNKEYSALLREINTYKADSSRTEEEALKRMSAVDEAKKQSAESEKQIEGENRRLAELNAQAVAREKELSDQIAEIERQRGLAATDVPADVRTQLERLADAHEGEAMAPVIRPHPKREEYVCGGCNMGVTLEQVNTLASRDDIQICNCCGRMLYPANPDGGAGE